MTIKPYTLVLMPIVCLILHSSDLTYGQLSGESYQIVKVDQPISIDANWDKAVWRDIAAITLTNYMGDKPEHFPEVQAKIAYDQERIYVIWKVNDKYVRAVARKHQDPVFQDSCVEFFFSPQQSVENGYFNLEMNCGGLMLFKQRNAIDEPFVSISEQDLARMEVAHSLPERVPEEIAEETTWFLEYSIPFDMLKGYYNLDTPDSGTVWRANFYKCADKTSHPHWITWSEVDYPKPQFHLPKYFGTLTFE